MRTIAEYESSQLAGGSSYGHSDGGSDLSSTVRGGGESFLAGLGAQQQQNQQRKTSGGAVAGGGGGGNGGGRAK